MSLHNVAGMMKERGKYKNTNFDCRIQVTIKLKDIHNIYTRAKKKYGEMKENVLKGTCPLYRRKFWKQHERRTQKMEKIRTRYNKNGKYDSVFFVNYTQGSKLAKECQR